MMNLSDREVRQKFLQCNYSLLSSCFYRFHQEQGKGVLVIIVDQEEGSINLEYETDLSQLFSEKTLKHKINPKLKSYNPNQELLVGFQLKPERKADFDNCILHSIGSSNFPVPLAAEIADTLVKKLYSSSVLCAA